MQSGLGFGRGITVGGVGLPCVLEFGVSGKRWKRSRRCPRVRGPRMLVETGHPTSARGSVLLVHFHSSNRRIMG